MAYLTSQELLNRFKIKSQTTLWRWQQPTQKIFKEPFSISYQGIRGF